MMLGLVPNIRYRGIDSGNTNAERAVSFLPFKRTYFGKCFVNPFGRIAFQELDCFRRGKRRRQRYQCVHVIRSSADGQRFDSIFSRDAAEIRPKPISNIRAQDSLALLRAPNAMNENAGE